MNPGLFPHPTLFAVTLYTKTSPLTLYVSSKCTDYSYACLILTNFSRIFSVNYPNPTVFTVWYVAFLQIFKDCYWKLKFCGAVSVFIKPYNCWWITPNYLTEMISLQAPLQCNALTRWLTKNSFFFFQGSHIVWQISLTFLVLFPFPVF